MGVTVTVIFRKEQFTQNENVLKFYSIQVYMDYLWIIMMFLSAVWTLILMAPIHCRGLTGEQVICPDEETNSSTVQLEWHEGE